MFLEKLAEELRKLSSEREKERLLLSQPTVKAALETPLFRTFFDRFDKLPDRVALLALATIGQEAIVLRGHQDASQEQCDALVYQLVEYERFYESIGGIIGYQATLLNGLSKRHVYDEESQFFKAPLFDCEQKRKKTVELCQVGLDALPTLAEIYPIGGLGSRLNLHGEQGETLPSAFLHFCGHTLLQGLIRDLQAREYLYFKQHGVQITVPVGLMTSYENKNEEKIRTYCEKKRWFGRPEESFRLFSQLSVPVATKEGNWSLKAPLTLNVQPGGHGALWRTAQEKGFFHWLDKLGKKQLLIRQINNPTGGTDCNLMVMVGIGIQQKKAFGFAACDRAKGAAEGVLVMGEKEDKRFIMNIEYTDFEHYKIDPEMDYPANTNLLFVDLNQMRPQIEKHPLPRFVLNMKQHVPFISAEGEQSEQIGGRLESMMQNISENLVGKEPPTFVMHNARKRTLSTTKKSYEPGHSLLETPEGVFYDRMANAHELLTTWCGMEVAPFGSPEAYLAQGPSLLFLYHPALGPLYESIQEKICGGKIAHNSELQLEIAEASIEQLDLDGSLTIEAHQVMGEMQEGILRYSERVGRCKLKNVTVRNRGLDRASDQIYWTNKLTRHESLAIILEGNSSFHAEDVVFEGNLTISVPDGEAWQAIQAADGSISYVVEKVSIS